MEEGASWVKIQGIFLRKYFWCLAYWKINLCELKDKLKNLSVST